MDDDIVPENEAAARTSPWVVITLYRGEVDEVIGPFRSKGDATRHAFDMRNDLEEALTKSAALGDPESVMIEDYAFGVEEMELQPDATILWGPFDDDDDFS